MRRILISEKNEFSSNRRESVSLTVAVRLLADFYSKVDEKEDLNREKVVISTTMKPSNSLNSRRS